MRLCLAFTMIMLQMRFPNLQKKGYFRIRCVLNTLSFQCEHQIGVGGIGIRWYSMNENICLGMGLETSDWSEAV